MNKSRDLGLLVIRVAVGGSLAAHGAQKLFGWFGGGGLTGTGEMFDKIGFRPGRVNAVAAGLGEAGGGALLAVGLATPAAGAAVAATMVVASSMHTAQGFFSTKGGFEYPAVLGTAAAGLALTGPGVFSIDHATGHRLNRGWMRAWALLAVGPAAAAVLARRRCALATAAGPVEDSSAE
jgi:putative oxidoreductase